MTLRTRIACLLLPLLAAACASPSTGTAALPADRFVAMSCADGKGFQVRRAPDGQTVRVRSHHGAAELQRQAYGRFTGDGYTLDLAGQGGVALDHDGKSQGKSCKRA